MGLVKRGERSEDSLFAELASKLARLTPSLEALEKALERLPGAEGVGREERVAVLRGLERAWHIMRLLHLLTRYFSGKLVFGGGSILNYLVMVERGEPPRLTFDLDSSWTGGVGGKRAILAEIVGFNKWLSEIEETLRIPVGRGKLVELYVVEHDAEKDVFPYLLPLRVPVVTRYDGLVFYRFLDIRDYAVIQALRRVFRQVLGVKDARIDYVRAGVSLELGNAPTTRITVKDVFGTYHSPVVTEIEYQLAMKILHKVGKDFGPDLHHNMHDVLKALLDLRLLDYVDLSRVSRYIPSENRRRILENARRNVRAVLLVGKSLWERNYHYILVRRVYRLEEIASRVLRNLETVLQQP